MNKTAEQKKQLELLNKTKTEMKDIVLDENNPLSNKFKNIGGNMLNLAKQYKREITKSRGTSQKYARYKYGQLVMVDFGLNIGNELCGNHFAIVFTNNDSPYSGLITVVPLSSKNGTNRISLGEFLSNDILLKLSDIGKSLSETINEYADKYKKFESTDGVVFRKLLDSEIDPNIDPNDSKQFEMFLLNKLKELCSEEPEEYIDRLSNTMRQLVEESHQITANVEKYKSTITRYSNKNRITYAIVEQVQTISKLRVLKPINEFDPIDNLLVDRKLLLQIELEIVKKLFSKASKLIKSVDINDN